MNVFLIVRQLVPLEPLEVQRRNVPHSKGLIYAKVELEAQGCDSTFTICQALVKKAVLHCKRAKGVYIFFHDCRLDLTHSLQIT